MKRNRYRTYTMVLMLGMLLNAQDRDLASSSAVNLFQSGGRVDHWLVLGPFSENGAFDTVQRSDTTTFSALMNHDFLSSIGGESGAFIQNYTQIALPDTKGGGQVRTAIPVSADSQGYVSLDTVFDEGSGIQTGYAFCTVESYISCRVRCYYGVDGPGRIILNGTPILPLFDASDSAVALSKYFDADLVQGTNRILVKTTNAKGRNRFTVELFPIRDSVACVLPRITAAWIQLSRGEIRNATDTLYARIVCNVPVPPHFLASEIEIHEYRKSVSRKVKPIFLFHKPLGRPFKLGLPDGFHGLYTVTATIRPVESRTIVARRHIFKGELLHEIDRKKKKMDTALSLSKEYVHIKPFDRFLLHGSLLWVHAWFEKYHDLSPEQLVDEFAIVDKNCGLIEAILHRKKPEGGVSYAVSCIRPEASMHDDTAKGYDYSGWLNYRYPERFSSLPQSGMPDTISAWIYLPHSINSRLKKVPLLLSLHGAQERTATMTMLESFGPSGYAVSREKFPFVVVTPQNKTGSYWDAEKLKTILDTILRTKRFDAGNVYATGVDMGGFAVWHLACGYPALFSKIVPVNGAGDKEKACAVKNRQVWSFVGGKNSFVTLEQVQQMVIALKECGGSHAELSLYPEWGDDIGNLIYGNEKIYEWLMGKGKMIHN